MNLIRKPARIQSILICLFFAVFSFFNGESSLQAQTVDQSSLHFHQGYTFIECNFDEYPQPVVFMLDMGTDHVQVNQDFVDRLKIESGQHLNFRAGTIQLESDFIFPANNQHGDSLARLFLGDYLNVKLYGGIIGNTVFNQAYISIDFANAMLYKYDSLATQKRREVLGAKSFFSFEYVSKQVFIEANLNGDFKAYFHFDNGIPANSFMEYRYAKKAKLDGLRAIPNMESKVIEIYQYDEDSIPISMTMQSQARVNFSEPSLCKSFQVKGQELGPINFETTDIDYKEVVFAEISSLQIVGSLAFGAYKNKRIDFDFPNRIMAISTP